MTNEVKQSDQPSLTPARGWDRRRFARNTVIVVVVFSLFVSLAMAGIKSLSAESDFPASAGATVQVIHPWVAVCLIVLGWICVGMLAVTGALAFFSKAALCGLGAVACICTMAILFGIPPGVSVNYNRWRTHNSVRTADGNTFHFLFKPHGKGARVALATQEDTGILAATYKVFGTAWDGDCIQVIRPAGASETWGQLHITDDGVIVGLTRPGSCCFAYDTRTGVFRGYGYAEGDVADTSRLSPFILIGARTTLEQRDVDWLLMHERKYPQEHSAGSEEVLRDALSHPNPQVREIAKTIFDIRAKRLAPATKPDSPSTEPVSLINALQELRLGKSRRQSTPGEFAT